MSIYLNNECTSFQFTLGNDHSRRCKQRLLLAANCCSEEGSAAGCSVMEDAGVCSQNTYPSAMEEGRPKSTRGSSMGSCSVSL